MKVVELPLDEIQLDPHAQPRLQMNEEVTNEYSEAMKTGAKFPLINVFKGPEGMILADGYHRFGAAKLAGLPGLPATVHEGDRRAAILHAVGANATHGLRRSDADKRRAVKTMLEDPEWQNWSDSKIADQCQVSRGLVAAVRVETEALHPAKKQHSTRVVKRGGKVYSMDLSKIRGGGVKKQTPSKVSSEVNADWLRAIDLVVSLPKNSLFQLHPAEMAPLLGPRGFRSEQARQLLVHATCVLTGETRAAGSLRN